MRSMKKLLGHITRLTGKQGHECLKCKRRECLQQYGDQLDESKQLFLLARCLRFLKQLCTFKLKRTSLAYQLIGLLAYQLASILVSQITNQLILVYWHIKNLAYYPTGHARIPGQRQRMIDILQPLRWAGTPDDGTEAMVNGHGSTACLLYAWIVAYLFGVLLTPFENLSAENTATLQLWQVCLLT